MTTAASAEQAVVLPPHSLEAERSVLGTMLLDREAAVAGFALLEENAFYQEAHRRIYRAILALCDRDETADLLTLTEELKRTGQIEAVGGIPYLTTLFECVATAANIRFHANIVRNAHLRRRAIDVLSRAQARIEAGENPAAVLPEIEALETGGFASRRRLLDAARGADEIVSLPCPRPRSLWGDGVISAGDFVILFGKPGTGKSWLALQLAEAIARGGELFGLKTEGSARAGVLQLELRDYAVKARLMAIGAGSKDLRVICRPWFRGAVDVCDADQWQQFETWCVEDRLDFLIIDALSRAHSADENKASEFSPVLQKIDRLREATGTAIAVVHHEPKHVEPNDDLGALRGTSRLQSDPNVLLRLVRLEKGDIRTLRFVKVSCAAEPQPIFLARSEAGPFVFTESPAGRADANRAKVRTALEAGGASGLTRRDLELQTGLGKSAVAKHAQALGAASVGVGKASRYVLSPASPTEDGAGVEALDFSEVYQT